jgi:hypothetical protein
MSEDHLDMLALCLQTGWCLVRVLTIANGVTSWMALDENNLSINSGVDGARPRINCAFGTPLFGINAQFQFPSEPNGPPESTVIKS